jgi:hypothetical protein
MLVFMAWAFNANLTVIARNAVISIVVKIIFLPSFP